MQLNQTKLSQPQEKITLYEVTWKEYDTLVTLFMDRFPGLSMTFLEGTLEIMGTSSEHERLKKIIARLLEMYAVEKRVIFNGYGNTTFRKEAVKRGLEPDECYCLGELKEVPDIAIEIALTSGENPRRRQDVPYKRLGRPQATGTPQGNAHQESGGIDKLSVYQGLGVVEVWFWQNNLFILYRLKQGEYQQIDRSEFLPYLDFNLLSQYVNYDNQTEAVIAYRDALKN